jgi:hypothetical protein
MSELEGRKPFPQSQIGRGLPKAERHSKTDVMEALFSGFYLRINDKDLDPKNRLAKAYW